MTRLPRIAGKRASRALFYVALGVTATILGGYILLRLAFIKWDHQIRTKTDNILHRIDHKELLAACREIMRNKGAYRRNPDIGGGNSHGESYPDPTDPNMPRVVQSLGASYIQLNKEYMFVEMGGGFYHYGILAFPADANDSQQRSFVAHDWGWGENCLRVMGGLWFYQEGKRS